eukprot:11528766-Alexandrium_andersonii.AAC.1
MWDSLWDVGLVQLLRPGEVRHHGGQPVVAQLFGVAKKGTDALQVIVDRRPRNALEMGLRKGAS